MSEYSDSLNQRYWSYQEARFPDWDRYLSTQRPRWPASSLPSPEAWRNVIRSRCDPQDAARLLARSQKERLKWFRSMNGSQALAQYV
jgi:hypothetical protein